MCYSAKIRADYKQFVRDFGAVLSLKSFYELFWRRLSDHTIEIPRAVESAFAVPTTEEERHIKSLVADHTALRAQELAEKLSKQEMRLQAAELKLQKNETKAAAEEKRISTSKIARLQAQLADLARTENEASDYRIFPGSFVPVMVMETGKRVLKPMRYHCRPAGKPASFDEQYPGCYNARRDSLKGFWGPLYRTSRGVVVLSAFYEHVPRHLAEGRVLGPGEKQKDAIVEFRPEPAQDVIAACLWSRWAAPGVPDLLSFALITEDPPPEVLAVGHDRCIVPLDPRDVDAWLDPETTDLGLLDAILDRRLRPYFGHELAGGGR